MDLQILLGDGAWSGKNTGRDAGVEELASGAATVGSELDEPVGGLDQVIERNRRPICSTSLKCRPSVGSSRMNILRL